MIEELMAEGWAYRDLPRMTPDALQMLLDIVGEENTKWITFAKYGSGAVRGQLMISPAGIKRAQEYSGKKTDIINDPISLKD